MSPVAVSRSSYDDSAIRYVGLLSVLWMTCFHIMGPNSQNRAWRYVSSSSPGGDTGAKLLSTIACLLFVTKSAGKSRAVDKRQVRINTAENTCRYTCIFNAYFAYNTPNRHVFRRRDHGVSLPTCLNKFTWFWHTSTPFSRRGEHICYLYFLFLSNL